MTKSEEFYQSALKLLRSRRRGQRPSSNGLIPYATPSSSDRTKQNDSIRGKPSCDGMRAWLNQMGHSDADIDSMRIIHVAGSKGKGSTCAFVEAFLEAHRRRTSFPARYGLYTSPSLCEEVERIRIDSENVSKHEFAKNLFEVWNRIFLENHSTDSQPKFLQLCLLVCIHMFIKEGIEVAILETHHGGQHDSTNIFPHPAATGIASLGFDHVAQLGPTIGDIAWHKAGIFKRGSPAFALAKQPLDAQSVLVTRANDLGVKLDFVEDDLQLPPRHSVLTPSVQRSNCSLAKALVSSYLEQDAPPELRDLNDEDINEALDNVHLPGRFQHLDRGQVQWCLDGAHNSMSIDCPIAWFSQEVTKPPMIRSGTMHDPNPPNRGAQSVLVFSHISTERDGLEVLKALIESTMRHRVVFDHVIFCYDGTREDGSVKHDQNFGRPSIQNCYADIWKASQSLGYVTNTSTIDETVDFIHKLNSQVGHVDVLITGSFHLVGGVMSNLRRDSVPHHSMATCE